MMQKRYQAANAEWIKIIRRTRQKTPPRAHESALAGKIRLPEALKPLILKAVQE